MESNTAAPRYSTLSIMLHWLMLVLMVAVYALIELREFYPRGSDPREAMKAWHFTLGLSVFVLVWLRIVVRLATAAPAKLAEPAWRSLSAKAVHLALYALMIVMPLAGWVILSAEGDAIPFWGLSLPAIAPQDELIAGRVKDLHELGGTIGYWLIGLHAAASLFHHHVLKDGLMGRMSLRGT
jgi:superoxide oxidase